MAESVVQAFLDNSPSTSWAADSIPVMINACTGKMGKAFIERAETAGGGLFVLPVSFGSEEKSGKTYQVCGKEFLVLGPSSNRENILATILHKYPNLIVVDFTVPTAVNANAELYCKVRVPFVMGTNGGDRNLLFSTVNGSNVYALIAPQMAKQVAAFHGAMEFLADYFPGAFSGYSLDVLESHQESEDAASATAKALAACFTRMGANFDTDQIESVRDSQLQRDFVGVPEEHLSGHACHVFDWISPDETAEFQFQHAIFGRSMNAEGAVAAVHFLSRKIKAPDNKQVYTFFDVMLERTMQ